MCKLWPHLCALFPSTAKKEDVKLSVRKLLNRHNIVFGDYTWTEFDEPFLNRNVQSVSIVDTELKVKDPQVTPDGRRWDSEPSAGYEASTGNAVSCSDSVVRNRFVCPLVCCSDQYREKRCPGVRMLLVQEGRRWGLGTEAWCCRVLACAAEPCVPSLLLLQSAGVCGVLRVSGPASCGGCERDGLAF